MLSGTWSYLPPPELLGVEVVGVGVVETGGDITVGVVVLGFSSFCFAANSAACLRF